MIAEKNSYLSIDCSSEVISSFKTLKIYTQHVTPRKRKKRERYIVREWSERTQN